MSTTSKSPRKVMAVAYAAAQRALPAYSHRFSPKKFTQYQLLACLVLKEFLKTDYRGVCQTLADCADLRATIELTLVPHWTTLQKAADRLLKKTPPIASWIRRWSRRPKPSSLNAVRH
jgi:hypothetical protein